MSLLSTIVKVVKAPLTADARRRLTFGQKVKTIYDIEI